MCVCVYTCNVHFSSRISREQSNYSAASLIDEYIDTHTDVLLHPASNVCVWGKVVGDHNRRMFFVHIAYILLV